MFDRYKERKATERELREAGRLPPGQVFTDKWPVLHAGSVPRFDRAKWDFKVWGLVDKPARWTYEEFLALPQTKRTSDFHCVTRWSKFDNEWTGVPFREVLARLQPKPEARFVLVHAEEGFTANVPLADLDRDEVLFAHSHNGAPLEPDHGFPLRLVVPHLYAWKSVKWVRGLEFLPADKPGFWEAGGYHMRGDPWREQRYSND